MNCWGPVNSLTELTLFLVEEEKIRGCERALGDLTVIGNKARSMADMIAEALRPGTLGVGKRPPS